MTPPERARLRSDEGARPNYPEDEPLTRAEAVALVLVIAGSAALVVGCVWLAIRAL